MCMYKPKGFISCLCKNPPCVAAVPAYQFINASFGESSNTNQLGSTLILHKSHIARETEIADTAQQWSEVRAGQLPKWSQAEAGVKWNLDINLSDFTFNVS